MKIGKSVLLIAFASMLMSPPSAFAQAKQTNVSPIKSDGAAMLKQDRLHHRRD
jgi:hypothetical protein